ncbi:organic hydroperoxide resistance protein [Pseudooceanicola sp. CBS1P-1]|uniref:Ohr family peroxiredoxin n=1 Tax=Pseudooceanicola albus TaxID=2692189 RepID=A0A6L7G4F6_9RHOB|nr:MULTISPECIES: organic hydroperoxide resistance protein [Pseudooceanicola]MBT9383056.1 organic hydroperoxide resistance protein [Pseudooceanicola endophyticus]MXN19244.1 Ohr family peroxiredoxin [Pseudooceanicola albus]
MITKTLYSTRATAEGGRNGRAATEDGALSVNLVMPKELGGPGGTEGTNPEQLFAAGYAACFLSALKMIAGQDKVKLPEGTRITTQVGIGPRPDGGFGLSVALEGHLPGLDADQADALMAKAHAACPYSAAIKGNVEVALSRA